jgi:hypothetical protein
MNPKKLVNYGYGIVAVLLSFIVPVALIRGGVWLLEHFGATVAHIAQGAVGFFVILLPLALVPRLRLVVGNVQFALSFVFGALFWLYCLGTVYLLWGIVGAILGLFTFNFIVVPAGLAFLFASGQPFSERIQNVLVLALSLVLIYGGRAFAVWLVTKFHTGHFESRFVRYPLAILVGAVAGYVIPLPVFGTLDSVLTDGKLIAVGVGAPLNWLVVSYMASIGATTGFIAGVMAEDHGKVVATISQTFPLILLMAVELVLNSTTDGAGQDHVATWTWIGLIPAIIGGHYGQRYIRTLTDDAFRDDPSLPVDADLVTD